MKEREFRIITGGSNAHFLCLRVWAKAYQLELVYYQQERDASLTGHKENHDLPILGSCSSYDMLFSGKISTWSVEENNGFHIDSTDSDVNRSNRFDRTSLDGIADSEKLQTKNKLLSATGRLNSEETRMPALSYI